MGKRILTEEDEKAKILCLHMSRAVPTKSVVMIL
jgi:hypothetical protein